MLHLIVNPVAGGGRARAALPALEARLSAAGLAYRVWVTAGPGQAGGLVAALPGLEPAVAVGGDGTVHEVAAGLVGTGRPMGVVPLGSGDDFAHGLGLRSGDLAGAASVLAAGRVRSLDSGEVNGKPFACGLGTGFDAEVGRAATAAPPLLRGLPRYLWALARVLPGLRPASVRVTADGELVHNGPGLLVAAMGMESYGGGFWIAPGADPADGCLDLVIGGRFSRLGALSILPRVIAGRHASHPEVTILRVREAQFEWDRPVAAHVDGELLEPARCFSVRVRPASLQTMTP